MQAFVDYYKLLSLPPSASDSQIKHQYHHLAMTSHPDHGGSEAVMRRLNDAYAVLSQPALKDKYDEVYRQFYFPKVAASSSAPTVSSSAGVDYTQVNVKYTFIMQLKAYVRYQLAFDLAWLALRILYAIVDLVRALLTW